MFDVDVARVVERDVLLGVAAADRKAAHDDFRGCARAQLAGCELEAADVIDRRVVEIAVSQLETGAAHVTEFLADHVDFAVSVGIAKPDDAARSEGRRWVRAAARAAQ